MPSPKKASVIALPRSDHSHSLKSWAGNFVTPKYGTLTLLGPIPKGIRSQHSRYVTLTRLTPTNKLLPMHLFVRRVCEARSPAHRVVMEPVRGVPRSFSRTASPKKGLYCRVG